jgi:hypothetical protein
MRPPQAQRYFMTMGRGVLDVGGAGGITSVQLFQPSGRSFSQRQAGEVIE